MMDKMDITEDVEVEEEVARICENMTCEENKEVKRYRPPPPLPFLAEHGEEDKYYHEMPKSFEVATRSSQPGTSWSTHNAMLPTSWHGVSRTRQYRGLRASHPYCLGGVGYNHNQQHDDYDGPSTSRTIMRPIPRKVTVKDITSALKNCKVVAVSEESNANTQPEIDPSHWETLAENRPQWRSMVRKNVYEFENERRRELDLKRDLIKSRPPANIHYNFDNGVLTCAHCKRTFTAKIGYISHTRACQQRSNNNV